jgi:hypothetical protein
MAELKTSINEIEEANEALYKEVARLRKVTKTQVKEIMDFVGQYVAGVIRDGSMEGVMLPYFGKIQPKAKSVKAYNTMMQNRRNGKDILYRVRRGHKITDYRAPEVWIADVVPFPTTEEAKELPAEEFENMNIIDEELPEEEEDDLSLDL